MTEFKTDHAGRYLVSGDRLDGPTILRMAEHYLAKQNRRGATFPDPQSLGKFWQVRLATNPSEEFHIMFLDCRHREIVTECLFKGTIDGCNVHPREVVRRALAVNAAAVCLAHSHPSGVEEPSEADRQITRHLQEVLRLIDVRVLDHFVVSTNGFCSMAARGWV